MKTINTKGLKSDKKYFFNKKGKKKFIEVPKKQIMSSLKLENVEKLKINYFNWKNETTFINKILLSIIMACLTGLCAQIKFYLPFTPVPITMQIYAVFLSVFLLGKYWSGISQLLYVSLGIIGIPWFANGKGGLEIIYGPTIGYLMGFIFSSFILGIQIDNQIRKKRKLYLVLSLLFSNLFFIYGLGLFWLKIWFEIFQQQNVSIIELLKMGLLPFILGDLLKVICSVFTGGLILPKELNE